MIKDVAEIRKLVIDLNQYRDAYYNRNESLITDREYDALYDKLVELEKATGFVMSNSPTQNVGYESISQLQKVKHNHPLLSLAKTTEINEFFDFFKGKPALLMAKMDGLTCSLLYRDGKLVKAESRGDGEVGEDITHNAKVFVNLPTEIPFKGEMIVDGECIITYHDFEAINKPLVEKAEQEATKAGLTGKDYKEYIRKHSYANPRNLVSGSVRQLNSEIAAKRNIHFVGWKLFSAKNQDGTSCNIDDNTSGLCILEAYGFDVVPNSTMNVGVFNGKKIVNTVADFEDAISYIKDDCVKSDYPIDGIVGTFDETEYGNSLGRTGHHPRHSLAFKFYQEGNETTLLDIEWSTSRTGLVNPVAVFEPVEIDGTTVTRATLNNVSIIKELELGIGDTITVIKANQIIPKITENLTRSNTYVLPDECPVCHSKLVINNENGRETLCCPNPICPAIIHDKIANFATRDAMNIVGISEERLRSLMDMGYVKDFESIYKLYMFRDEIAKNRGWGQSSIDGLLKAIEESKKCKLQNVIVAIGIPGIGKSAAKTISRYCVEHSDGNLLRTFISLAKDNTDWSVLPEIGENTSDSINEYVNKFIDEIEPLVSILEVSADDNADNTGSKLSGKTFCITGKLERFDNRNSLIYDIERNGGVVVSGVSAKTNYLITNDKDSGSSKNIAAAKYGTVIISEEEYIRMTK